MKTIHLLSILVVAFIALHFYRLSDGPNGYHKWREADTAAVAHNFSTESWDFFAPRIDARGQGSGVTGMELPVYNYITAIAFYLGGEKHLWPRLISVVCGALCLLAFYVLLCQLMAPPDVILWSIFSLAASPLFFFYSRKIQPDIMGLMFSVAGFGFFLAWLQKNKKICALLSAVCLFIAGAIKPTFLCVGLPMLLALKEKNLRHIFAPRFLIFGALILGGVFGWLHYARHLGETYFFLSLNFDEVFHSLGGWDFYSNTFLTFFWEMVIGLTSAGFFVIGGRIAWLNRKSSPAARTFGSWIVGGFLVCPLVATHLSTGHDYYMLPFVPAAAYLSGLGLSTLRLPSVARLLIVLAISSYGLARTIGRYGKPYDFQAGREVAAKHLADDAKIIALGYSPPFIFYQADRKGWFLFSEADTQGFLKAKNAGARYFLVEDSSARDLSSFQPYLGDELYSFQGITAWELK